MNTEKWERFISKTNNLKTEAHFEQFLATEIIDELLSLFSSILQGFSAQNMQHLGIKTFINGERNLEFQEAIVRNPPSGFESLEQWALNLSKQEKFGIILNNLEKYSDEFAVQMAKISNGLTELMGLPLNGLATLFFMGNYGFTPFGIHKENPGEEGFLIHLGPGEKTFYTWKTGEYLKLSNGSTNHPINNEFLKVATAYKMKPGDAFFVPSDIFHIAETNDFSLSVVLDYMNPTIGELKRKLANLLAESIDDQHEISRTVLLKNIDESIDGFKSQISLDGAVENAFKKHISRLMSNAGFHEKNQSRPNSQELSNSSFKLKDPFKITYLKETNRLRVFARGFDDIFLKSETITHWIDGMNGGNSSSIDELKATLASTAPQETWHLFGFLLNANGLEKSTTL